VSSTQHSLRNSSSSRKSLRCQTSSNRSQSRSTSTEDQEHDRRKNWIPMKRTSKKKVEQGSLIESSSSRDEEDTLVKPKHMMKPLKFDGRGSFETFMAEFSNCAKYKWNQAQELAFLRNSLEEEAANVLWDNGKKVTDSLSGLKNSLEMRFGSKTFPDKHRIELRNRRCKQNESLQSIW